MLRTGLLVVVIGALLGSCAGPDPRSNIGDKAIGGAGGGAGGVIFAPDPQKQPKR